MTERSGRIVDMSSRSPDEDSQGIRPTSLENFVGQAELKEKLSIYIKAAKMRGEPLDHCLFYGPPGLGKTTLAGIIAREMQGQIRITSGPALERAGDLAAILSNLQPMDVLFIDEIHRLSSVVEEVLYPGMEDFSLDIIVGKGPMARNIRLTLPPFTLVGATTRLGLITSPLRARFGIVEQLNLYEPDELVEIVMRGAAFLGVDILQEGARLIAKRARGTPRIALRLLRRVRDVAEVGEHKIIDAKLACEALDMLGIDAAGLDECDRRYLRVLVNLFGGGPVGLSTLSAALQEESQTIEDIYEPFLIQKGLIERTPRGRKATGKAYSYLGVREPDAEFPQKRLGLVEDEEI
ncbi:MAG TPA: Holliday junction branch migration DNA helicase RuvB [Synergistaceae bacterium]|jgi:Holliday junction DNA helicase RuvB|nr:MAG: Holliday junction ATP-dependent DNA helicase RuvB [Synergistales bacterium 53_16]KUL03422.1 MAG: Holliday junction ATP-dependent DNA helicase RuvB [Synergistales bacterium 54_9]MDK2845834.1 holliday junction helicase RuvB [Synergistales bacterium]HAA48067.1 Holliday junction branch migration DNA helicase RuvB [Synergistaceae bacterium]MDN5335762.1 holliday junction helicase RuvB [Synergistales bacterium]